MEEERIELPLYLGVKVQKRLREKFGIETDDKIFLKKDLEVVDELEIVPPLEGGLKGIELLTNIEKLIIGSVGNTAFQTQRIPSIVDEDIYSIAQCSKLKELSIINQSKIDCLDCSKFEGLTSLTIKNNRGLRKIEGLEQITTLEKLTCYGNEGLYGIDHLDKVILNNQELYATELDFLLFPDAIGYNKQNHSYNSLADERLNKLQNISKAVYVESMMKKEVNIPHSKMMQVHKKCLDILEKNEINGDNIEVAEKIEQYLAHHIKYNINFQSDGTAENKSIVGARRSANGLYTTIMNESGNCEGFTRAMQYLLKIKGIHARNVYCMPKPENTDISGMLKEEYHSVICLENTDLYSDPCYEAICLEQRR